MATIRYFPPNTTITPATDGAFFTYKQQGNYQVAITDTVQTLNLDNNQNITYILFPNDCNITSFGENCFKDNKKLKMLDLRNTKIRTLENGCIDGCNLETLLLPDTFYSYDPNCGLVSQYETLQILSSLSRGRIETYDNALYESYNCMFTTKNTKQLHPDTIKLTTNCIRNTYGQTKLVVTDKVKMIDPYALSGNQNINTVEIDSHDISIKENAFKYTNVKRLVFNKKTKEEIIRMEDASMREWGLPQDIVFIDRNNEQFTFGKMYTIHDNEGHSETLFMNDFIKNPEWTKTGTIYNTIETFDGTDDPKVSAKIQITDKKQFVGYEIVNTFYIYAKDVDALNKNNYIGDSSFYMIESSEQDSIFNNIKLTHPKALYQGMLNNKYNEKRYVYSFLDNPEQYDKFVNNGNYTKVNNVPLYFIVLDLNKGYIDMGTGLTKKGIYEKVKESDLITVKVKTFINKQTGSSKEEKLTLRKMTGETITPEEVDSILLYVGKNVSVDGLKDGDYRFIEDNTNEIYYVSVINNKVIYLDKTPKG